VSEPNADLRRLLESAGARPEPPAEDLARIKEVFRAEWREQVRRRTSRRTPRLLALAAMLVAAAGLAWWLWSRGPAVAPEPAAHVESVSGGPAAGLEAGREILAGTELETTSGRAALRLTEGSSLRLDTGTRVRLVSAAEVRLDRGAVYLDSGPGGRKVSVRTSLGVVSDVGTRFEVRLLAESLRIRVREGEVRIAGGAGPGSAAAGEEVILLADGAVERHRVAPYGPEWDWVVEAAPPLAIDGLTLDQVLAGVARETGWTIDYEDEALAASAASIRVHGPAGGLAPDQALDVVLPGAGLSHRVVDGRLFIARHR
jgi:ferric-dicitrate binding protein FerR (iron transport regulator)